MKSNCYYNFKGYLNTVSLMRDKIISDEYMMKSINSHKKANSLRQTSINESERKHPLQTKTSSNTYTLPSIKQNHSSDSLSLLFSMRDDHNKKVLSGFNFNEKFDEFKKRRLGSNKNQNISIKYQNQKIRERIKRINSPLSKDKLFKNYDEINKPVKLRIQKVYPNESLSIKLQKMQKKVKLLNLK